MADNSDTANTTFNSPSSSSHNQIKNDVAASNITANNTYVQIFNEMLNNNNINNINNNTDTDVKMVNIGPSGNCDNNNNNNNNNNVGNKYIRINHWQ